MAVKVPFKRDLEFEYGVSEELSPLIRRVIAQNPSAFTFHGTGTYIIGKGEVAVVDPGPLDGAHVGALMAALKGEMVTHILITHTHHDHSPAAEPLKQLTGAKTYGFGPHGGGVSDFKIEEGGDTDFMPDVKLEDGDVILGNGWTVDAIHTPGHLSNHVCFGLREENTLFTGDHVMGWSTTVVSPPDGNMSSYMQSLEKLLGFDYHTYWPTHGPAITETKPFVEALIAHRQERMDQIRSCLGSGPMTIKDMVKRMYVDVPENLHPAAARSVYAHILHMLDTGELRADGNGDVLDLYRLV
ncbi:MBL fold metallo-hydrolase [Sneathiella litorea]|uniref:MBL fold metallo-hydrolase n=1 Tax=Sneathiella litorea TaxID=2606216 RepID=A0A6L8WCE4_9PROT|nr:MBL fold metallo-hydrolase [Sneathiella litorea]MZR32090.1 MBL fold metallo-hydrolase [Sneathiella litorea]